MFGIKKLQERLERQKDDIITLSKKMEVMEFNKKIELFGFEVEYKTGGLASMIMHQPMYDVYKDGDFYTSFEDMSDIRKWFAGYEAGVDDINVTIECDCDECDEFNDEPYECDDVNYPICNDYDEPEVTIMPTKKSILNPKKSK